MDVMVSSLRMNEMRELAHNFANAAGAATVIGVVGALAYKVAGAALSLLTGGRYTFLGTAIISSPYFYLPLAFIGFSSVLAFAIEKVCSNWVKK